ncbi:MAG: hypothetical protein WC225_04940 [Acholeplasmataceae bacterium]|nr:hypothetical protein [Acholeplasmataceae bacterium]
MKKKLNVLQQVAHTLNQTEVMWAIGGSVLLYFKGIAEKFNDIDIMIKESDVERAKAALLKIGKGQPNIPHPQYKTKHFLEFKIDGIDVDVIAGFTIVYQNETHYFPLKEKDIVEKIDFKGEMIPLQSIKTWRKYYQLMERNEKVKLIDQLDK